MAKKGNSSAVACAPADDRKWQVEDALRTLNRAEEIRRDRGMMRDVKKLATEQIKSLQAHVGSPTKPEAKNQLMGSRGSRI